MLRPALVPEWPDLWWSDLGWSDLWLGVLGCFGVLSSDLKVRDGLEPVWLWDLGVSGVCRHSVWGFGVSGACRCGGWPQVLWKHALLVQRRGGNGVMPILAHLCVLMCQNVFD